MRKLFHALASLWMTIPILVVIAAILIFATFYDGLDVTIGAVRKDWYRSWWFNGLLGLLAVNLIACTVKRKPYQFWMWGYLKTHSGILLIIVGSMVSSMFKIYGDMPISKGGSLDYVQLEDQRELTLQWFGADKAYTFPADFNWYRASEPNEVYEIPDSESRVRIKRFFPNVVRQPAKLPERVEVVIHQGNMETPPFVIPVNKATPISGSPLNITFVNTSEERYLDLKNAGTEGSLEILIGEESLQIDVTQARTEVQPLPGDGTLKVLEVYESLVIDEDGNVVDIAGNPGIKIEVTHPTLGGTYFVLEGPPAGAFYSEGEKKGQAASFEILYQSPLKGSHFAILRTPEGWRYFTTSSKGDSVAGETELGGKVRLPFMPVKLEIEVRNYLSSTDVVARPVPPQENQALYPALEIEFESGEERVSGFLLFDETPERDMSRDFAVGGRKLRATFSPVKYRIMQMVLYLKDARQVNHPGTMNAAVFESDIVVEDLKTGLKHEATVGVNYPFTLRGYSFYQSGFDGSNPDRPRSIFQVLHDPGTNIIYTGSFLTFSGTIFMFYLKPMILRARGRSQRLGGKSLKKMEKILFAFFSLLVPFAVIFLHISRDWDPLRTYERGRIVAVSWIVVLSILMCYLGFFVL
jgi:hypothetical protein